ncbi:MAG: hypothetical protein RLZZ272_556 [Actinomycetota bacterium]
MSAPPPTGASVPALRLVVIGDSTATTDANGPCLPDDERLYPRVAARTLAGLLDRRVEVVTVGRPGHDLRESLTMLHKDPHVRFEVVAPADAVVVAVGSFDHAPRGTPPVLDAIVPFLRPDGLRRRVRRALHRAHPWLVRATGARRLRTPAAVFDRRYALLLEEVRGLTLGRAVGLALGPTSHRSPHYGLAHPRHPEREAHQLAIAGRHGFLTQQVWPLVAPHASGLNPDGIHWPEQAHAAVGVKVAERVAAAIRAGTTLGPPTTRT